ncbi:MAG: YjbH domain-containing protein [Phocaeicola sp.]|uniref:YjbH domain-containing protein n=1 Tax=Phocaeicola TaxID=909656 RepID=UPI00234FADBA|nr:YjbH domain-containing protein [Phocaeicola oris]MCE2615612.1 YjbH domain-containing protein [Phocaeicola oris]
MIKKVFCLVLILFSFVTTSKGQYTCGVTGLLHMPSAEMQKDGTFMFGGNFMNKENLPNKRWWGYNSYNYYINITFFKRLEVSYICTLVKGQENISYWPKQTWGKFVNQDRHFAARFQAIKEGEFWEYMPSIVLGVNDPTTATETGHNYTKLSAKSSINGFFNRWYIAATKHFNIPYGELGVHLAYLYNRRKDYHLNGPAIGVNFKPDICKDLNVILEYDAKTINFGAIYSLWHDHLNLLAEMQEGKYFSGGITFKVNLLGGNKWNTWK